jgi:hypothetical protein
MCDPMPFLSLTQFISRNEHRADGLRTGFFESAFLTTGLLLPVLLTLIPPVVGFRVPAECIVPMCNVNSVALECTLVGLLLSCIKQNRLPMKA